MNIKIPLVLILVCCAAGYATAGEHQPRTADQAAQVFLNYIQKDDKQAAHDLFTPQLAKNVSFDQFSELLSAFEERWGTLQSSDTALFPFHQRIGEEDLLPPDIPKNLIRGYTYELKFDNVTVNCDITVVSQGGQYKIAWFSFWGSETAMSQELREKMEEIFQKPLFQ